MAREISNHDDVIDSRDVIERIDELSAEEELTDEESTELANLQALASEAEGYAEDWQYGAGLIRDSYFVTYAQELADDLYGKELAESRWPFSCIDWEHAARELQTDYTSVTFDGIDYWIR